jgi:hypothetical protein
MRGISSASGGNARKSLIGFSINATWPYSRHCADVNFFSANSQRYYVTTGARGGDRDSAVRKLRDRLTADVVGLRNDLAVVRADRECVADVLPEAADVRHLKQVIVRPRKGPGGGPEAGREPLRGWAAAMFLGGGESAKDMPAPNEFSDRQL